MAPSRPVLQHGKETEAQRDEKACLGPHVPVKSLGPGSRVTEQVQGTNCLQIIVILIWQCGLGQWFSLLHVFLI